MVRTRVGYCGGTTPSPTYRNIGDHSEAIQIDFDPARISYRALLGLFVAAHNPCATPWSNQYRSAVFVHDDTQRAEAETVLGAYAEQHGTVRTAIHAYERFTWAEDYHQKFRLRNTPALLKELAALYPDGESFANSTAVTRVNGWLAGVAHADTVEADLAECGLSDAAITLLRRRLGK